MTDQRVLVTGAAGFIGSHVADHCLSLGMEVVAVDDLSGGQRANVPTAACFELGDLRDQTFVKGLWKRYRRFEHVYHLAAYAAEGLSHFIRRYNYETNLIASVNLINEAVNHGTECFVFTSSIAVYGKNQVPMKEDMVPAPEDPYGVSKYAVELDLKAAHELFGMEYVIFRPHNVYGERQNIADRYRNVIGIFMNQLLQGMPMTIFGDGSQTRAFSYIDDVAPIIARSPLEPSARLETFNVGADTPYSVLDLARATASALGKPCEILHLSARNEVVHAFADHRKAQSVFGLGQTVDLHSGLRRMALGVAETGPAQPTVFENIEISKNMPASWSSQVRTAP